MSVSPTDFADACDRHWEDGESLLADERLANADQLFGLAAECGLKRTMLRLGMNVDAEGVPAEKKHKVHIDRLWDTFQGFASSQNGARYAAQLPASNPFSDWSIHNRYAHRSHFSREVVASHRGGAAAVREVLQQAEFDGSTP